MVKCLPLHNLKDCTVGIDAAYFLRNLGPEGVLSALGGSPLSLGARITAQVTKLRNAGLSLFFIFDGLEYGLKIDPFAAAAGSARAVTEGFALYDASDDVEANRILKHAGKSTEAASHFLDANLVVVPLNAPLLLRSCEKTLHQLGIPFSVAPYSSLAQVYFLGARNGRPEADTSSFHISRKNHVNLWMPSMVLRSYFVLELRRSSIALTSHKRFLDRKTQDQWSKNPSSTGLTEKPASSGSVTSLLSYSWMH